MSKWKEKMEMSAMIIVAITFILIGAIFIPIRSKYDDGSGMVHIFKNRNITAYPGSDLEGQMVRVYLNRNASDLYKHYYMDVDAILQKVVEH